MKKFATLTLVLALHYYVHSQDSNFVDLGRTQLRKNFSQTITIKGSDLEKIPAATLQQAIDVWLYGSLSSVTTCMYVVDGHVIADVNIYSIQDIEEITLVQNASTQLNGAFRQQQMLVIKTRKAQEQGLKVEFTGQSAMITKKLYDPSNDKTLKGENSFFHQYLVSATKKTVNINTGLSVGFLRDVSVLIDSFIKKQSPNDFRRFRLNHYFDWNINSHHQVLAKLNFISQPSDLSYVQQFDWFGSTQTNTYAREGDDWNAQTDISINSQWPNGLSNRLSAGYSALRIKDEFLLTVQQDASTTPDLIKGDAINKTGNFQLTNTIRWSGEKNNWSFSPALNFSYRYLRDRLERNTVYPQQVYDVNTTNKGKKFLLTPSFDLEYKNAVNLQVGALTDISRSIQHRFYPYASFSSDINALAGWNTNYHLKIFASASSTGYFLDHAYPLRDFSMNETDQLLGSNPYPPPPNQYQNTESLMDSNFYNCQLGTTLDLFNERLILSYNFEMRNYMSVALINTQWGSGLWYPQVRSATHDLRATVKAIETSAFSWLTSIHFTSIKNKALGRYNLPPPYLIYYHSGENDQEKRSWRSGWNNRLNYRNAFLGLDLLCDFSRPLWTSTPLGPESKRVDLFSIHDIYGGYHFTGKQIGGEFYLTLRNPYQNENYMRFMDTRSYYGAGFKLDF